METARDLGADMAALGLECRLDLQSELPEEFPVGSYLSLLDAAARQLSDPLFGLKVGSRSRVTDAKAYSLVLLACKDIRSVVELVTRYEALVHDVGRSYIVEAYGVAHYRVHSPWTSVPGFRQFIDSAAASVRAQSTWLTGLTLRAFRFSTTYDLPAGVSREQYESALGAPVHFGAEFNEVAFPAALLSLPAPSPDSTLFSSLKQIADRRLAMFRRNDAPLISEVRDRLREQMKLGRIGLSEIAGALGASPRTLQRKLNEAAVTFSDLLDDVRREQAQEYLVDAELSLTEVAFLLGFNEQSSFNHAFRRWFDTSPTEWRAAHTRTRDADA